MTKIAVLGPEYSYSHIIALKAFPDSDLLLCKTIPEIFDLVSKKQVDSGIAPIENLIHGSVRESLTSLQKYKVKINKTLDFPIALCIASKSNNFTKIISKQEALSQCSNFIKSANKSTEECPSTSRAMEIASTDSSYAAIGSKEAAKKFNLIIIKDNIGDNSDNITRFILISLNESIPKEKARTSMMIIPKKDKPGLLFEILSIFKDNNINLTKIESIPTAKKLGEYEFFIEIEGSMAENRIKSALSSLQKIHAVYSFGSYAAEII